MLLLGALAAGPWRPCGGEDACGADPADEGSTCNHQVPSRQLRWRSLPYQSAEKGTYGGPLVVNAMAGAGFEGPVQDDDWDLFWTHHPMSAAIVNAHLPRRHRLVNHCQYFKGGGQKCILARHLEAVAAVLRQRGQARDSTAKGLRRHLTTYQMRNPEHTKAWREALRRDPERCWLVKACTGGASQGIQIVSSADEGLITKAAGTWAVAQEYLHEPRLSNGRKFHVFGRCLSRICTFAGAVAIFRGSSSAATTSTGAPGLRRGTSSRVFRTQWRRCRWLHSGRNSAPKGRQRQRRASPGSCTRSLVRPWRSPLVIPSDL